ncbi:thiamine pyrophosphate-binding protein [Microbacterium sp. YY-01]|uniref:thiamine pyrophosphate-binding protein n=1 Tax=Microbacterium sp. YY-01 TaxID=3421634 RepID=UPI003D162C4A
MSSVSAHVARTLAHYVDAVFGVMGNGNAYFLDALSRDALSGNAAGTDSAVSFTAVRHEQGAVVAADAYFRASQKIAAATTTYGAGFTNTLTALAEAAQARVPLVLVTGDEPTSGRRPWDVDQIALASGVGVRTYTVGRSDASATTTIAVEHALTYQVPVVLAIPYDVATAEAGEIPDAAPLRLPAPLSLDSDHASATLDTLVQALVTAKRPLLLAGRGAWLADAGEALSRLAELSRALTVTTALGRSIFADDRYDLGVAGGFGAHGAMELVRQADTAVVFGASLNQFTMRFGELFAPGTALFQVDTAPAATHAHVTGFIRGDARVVAEAAAERLAARHPEHASPADHTPLARNSQRWRTPHEVATARTYTQVQGSAADGRVDPRAAAQRLAELLPDDRVVVSDGGHFIGWANMYWPVAAPNRHMMVGTAFQSIGLGWPSVVGAARAQPESTIVLTTGDGGGLMALADLESAIRTAGGRGMAVVWNDAAYGAEVHLYGLLGLEQEPMRIPEVDFAGLARAAGAEAIVVHTLDDLDAVQAWRERDVHDRKFLVVDLRISGSVVAPYQEEIVHVNTMNAARAQQRVTQDS